MAEGARHALIVASSDYTDPELRQLQAPAADARALEAVLRDPGIGGFEVRTLLNRPNQEVTLAVEEFFADRQPDDMLLLHFSCHGIKDEDGELYFAMSNSMLHRLASTALAANFVNQRMNRSRSKRVVLLLDCCYAGAFERGMMARAGQGVGIEGQFAGGRGRAVITASDAMQYAYEGGGLAVTGQHAVPGQLGPSVFTSALVRGLRTGEADRDQDGQVALDELYDYIYDKVQAVTPSQTPCKWTYGIRGELVIARRSRPVTTPSPLPDDVRSAVESRLASVRVGAVQELEILLHGRHQGLALAARLTLEQLTDDDSRTVSAAAAAALGTAEPPSAPPDPEPPEASVETAPMPAPDAAAEPAPVPAPVTRAPAGDAPAADRSLRPDPGPDTFKWPDLRPDSAASGASRPVPAQPVPAQPVPAQPVPAQSVPAQSVPAQSVPAQSVPAQAEPASEAQPLPAPGGRSAAAALLSTGFVILTAIVVITGLDNLVQSIAAAPWPWWVVLFACVAGIAVILGAFRRYRVRSAILTLVFAWNLVFSVSVIIVWGSFTETVVAVLRTEFLAGAVLCAALCVWAGVLISRGETTADLYLAIFLGLFAVALVLAAVAISHPPGSAWYPTGIVTLVSALALPPALIRARRSAAEAAPGR
jgi:hypothetical protein